ncbi:MAG: GNAT family N-acyltransferase [Gammaproteobacteria bacterium]|nr:GNAT family N-acyltransferase [Gammaproteobacteria bacterium]
MQNPLALSKVNPLLRWALNKLTRLHVLRDWYDEWLAGGKENRGAPAFLDYTLSKLGVSLSVDNPERLQAVPSHGPLIVVANHPLGGLEGMLLSRLLLSQRSDLKVMANDMLLAFPEFSDLFIGVDVLNPARQQSNARGLRQASQHLANGGALLVFPAGTVSRLKLPGMRIEDEPWLPMIGRLAIKYKAACLPIYISNRNSLWFYFSDYIHKRLRTLLLPRAMLAKRDTTVAATIGHALYCDQLPPPVTAGGLMQYLRVSCELLGDQSWLQKPESQNRQRMIEKVISPMLLQEQMARLESYCVDRQGNHAVYCAPFEQLGCVAEQLAIERERTFRAAGEGTGLERDRDRFDPHYWHVWAWDHAATKLIGGYRAANISEVMQQQGLNGLYSHSLFHYDEAFIQALGGAIEVGRSFVCVDYQRNLRALDLLWRGIGAFVVQNPDCHTLFGCVSISRRYSPLARALLADTLLTNHTADSNIRLLVRPISPLSTQDRPWDRALMATLSSVAIINKLLGHSDAENRVPTLIRHYLSLNGKFIDFSLNHGFNEALDGLIMVDLRLAPQKYLDRYLGKPEAKSFLETWRQHVA